MSRLDAPRIVVVGLGNPYRGDDGVGPLVATRAAREAGSALSLPPPADTTELIDRWAGADAAVVVDATRSGRPPGTVRVWEADCSEPGPAPITSSHGLGLAEALRLGRALGVAPGRVVVVGIEGVDFRPGDRLSAAVAAAVPAAMRAVIDVIGTLAAGPPDRHRPVLWSETDEIRRLRSTKSCDEAAGLDPFTGALAAASQRAEPGAPPSK
jgi:hydrogenase maturation protease